MVPSYNAEPQNDLISIFNFAGFLQFARPVSVPREADGWTGTDDDMSWSDNVPALPLLPETERNTGKSGQEVRRVRSSCLLQLETALVPRRKVITETLQPPCYEEVIEVDRDSLPTYWQVSSGETLARR